MSGSTSNATPESNVPEDKTVYPSTEALVLDGQKQFVICGFDVIQDEKWVPKDQICVTYVPVWVDTTQKGVKERNMCSVTVTAMICDDEGKANFDVWIDMETGELHKKAAPGLMPFLEINRPHETIKLIDHILRYYATLQNRDHLPVIRRPLVLLAMTLKEYLLSVDPSGFNKIWTDMDLGTLMYVTEACNYLDIAYLTSISHACFIAPLKGKKREEVIEILKPYSHLKRISKENLLGEAIPA